MNMFQFNRNLHSSQSSTNLQRKNYASSPGIPTTSHNKENIINSRNRIDEKYTKG